MVCHNLKILIQITKFTQQSKLFNIDADCVEDDQQPERM